uniref:non-specific serine/threonine protein kinase n=1 Tax=Leersia perrieri TaxID=77586 RepID=A0A0D9VE42_9ORYZ
MGGSRRRFLLPLLLLMLCAGCRNGRWCAAAAAAQRLPQQEVEALMGIARKLNKMDWDFTVDPCTGSKSWVNSSDSTSYPKSTYPKELMRQNLSGVLPEEVVNLTYLTNLSLQDNCLSGTVPKELGRMPFLKSINLEGNQLEGPIPPELGNIISLERFRIDGTNISGRIPSFIKNWQRVNRMRVTDLSGPSMKFPPLQYAQHLTKVVLRNCSIYGEIPDYLGQMQYLILMDLSFNRLTGQIPKSFGEMGALQYLYLTDNMLTGDLPGWMLKNKASNKVNMDVSYNNFTDSSLFINCGGKRVEVDGNIYEDDSSRIGTSTFVLSDDRKWAYSSTGDFVGNPDADYIARNTSKLILANPELYTEARLSPLSLKYYGLCMENGEYSVKLHFAEIMFTEDNTFSSNGKRIFDVFIQGTKVLKDFNIQDEAGGVHRVITKNFTTNITENTLEIHLYWGGKGTTGVPDRGVYGPLISAISVTQCIHFFYHGRKTDTSDIQTRTQYFFSLKEIESATKHFDPANKIGRGDQLKLDWPTRYNICLGTAKGLCYLHEESTLKIIHRDIKPSNILLDERLQPKISDFGLAKLNDDRARMSTRIAGTVGYMAPEYATRGCLTYKADVYSFGVVTLEIVSGMSNTSSMSDDEYLHLLDWAERLKQEGKLLEIVDQRLGSRYSQDEALRMLNVALLCTNTSPAQRPKMSSVVSMLCGLAPIEAVPDEDFNLSEHIRRRDSQSNQSMNNSLTEWSYAPSSDPSILLHNSMESGYLPSSSSPSSKL